MPQPGTMKIVTLNLRHGGGPRIGKLIDYLIGTDADAIVCTEYQSNARGEQLRSRLKDKGYRYFREAKKKRGVVLEKQKTVNRVAIATRQPPTWIKLEPAPMDAHRIVGCELDGLLLLGVYFYGLKEKTSLFDYLLAGWPDHPGERLLIGDFNTGRHHMDEAGATFNCEDRFRRLGDGTRYVDLWRHKHGKKARACTWESNRGGKFRLDHAFGSTALAERVTSCTYDHTTREKDPVTNKLLLSDHSAMIVEIAPR